eukprot:GHRQ01015109.1.p2 GENE.GHRQ01015109.1~~GHRQ01015109.1.p2  ORF type:complete len:133 (+),score=51.80 GHRQ01015109.1:867-1265(+)
MDVRLQEAKEREWRAKEKAAAERQAAMMEDLAAAREAQMRSKLVAQATMAQVEQTEFMRVLAVNQEKEEQQRSQVRAGTCRQPATTSTLRCPELPRHPLQGTHLVVLTAVQPPSAVSGSSGDPCSAMMLPVG